MVFIDKKGDICLMEVIKAVITADIVNSSLLTKAEMYSLRKAIEKLLVKHDLRFTFYRGDSFNAVCEVSEALKIVALLRTRAIQASADTGRHIDIRVALGIGIVEEPFKNVSTAKGEAFILSGREMDRMEKDGPRLTIRCHEPVADAGLMAVALFTDFIIRKLTTRQAEVIYALLQGATQIKAARKLKKSQSTINKHAQSAHWKELMRVMSIYLTICKGLILDA